MKYLIVLSMLLLGPGIQAFDTPEVQELRKEVQQLRKEVRRLEKRVMALEPDTPKGHSMQWGCYLNDIRAGGLFAHAATEAEARGKVLNQCSNKNGACFEQQITCSKSD
ncbi:hypothetical protein [Endozoicomonas elysicola]|uniref:DUF4189 domain-containing protein n=1 Tax=Endozoicomonas elysicola TaxID=305900 RepID=A0A081KAB5_9GAMM|nr:hypothetical protein [Endozoicomonas elysicola]KEI71091.1 hypothetical protein GV64_10340 [Endozoicomonas elysicola]